MISAIVLNVSGSPEIIQDVTNNLHRLIGRLREKLRVQAWNLSEWMAETQAFSLIDAR